MSWTLCSSGAAINEAGVHANSTIVASAAALAEFSEQIEGFICMETHFDWVTNYSSVPTQIQNVLKAVSAAGIGSKIAKYDITGMITREADMIMNYNDSIWGSGLKFLSIKQNQTLN